MCPLRMGDLAVSTINEGRLYHIPTVWWIMVIHEHWYFFYVMNIQHEKVQLSIIQKRTEHVSATFPGYIERCHECLFLMIFHAYSMQRIISYVIWFILLCLWANKTYFKCRERKFGIVWNLNYDFDWIYLKDWGAFWTNMSPSLMKVNFEVLCLGGQIGRASCRERV